MSVPTSKQIRAHSKPSAPRSLASSFFSIIVGICVGLYFRFRPTPYYHRFICHHKADAAAQARYLKILLHMRTSQKVFIYSDDLSDLDTLFDTVRMHVGELLAFLTRKTLTRPWCAGEVATAFRANVKVLCVYGSGFVPPSQDDMAKTRMAFLRRRWSRALPNFCLRIVDRWPLAKICKGVNFSKTWS